eukprot:CAMPEP_0176495272 /NCGR_PEP_ID=MMETSP0200_2-20121128/10559_1 /TAXON_ID=947934 /ORGANISM="Chaetoceros sp., Strain GSL56" /LENGTH=998 /DNA_ID=CAMNT_0017893121 /DNA_START=355 /DNA_END=3351 /DNA_ORIENTATION=-
MTTVQQHQEDADLVVQEQQIQEEKNKQQDIESGVVNNNDDDDDNNNNGSALVIDDNIKTDISTGLTTDQVNKAIETYGTNEIPVKITPFYVLFLRQFTGFLPFLIEIAAIISLAVQDYVDFGIIAGILLVNGLLGFREEYHARKSLEEISNAVVSEITVRRNGNMISIPTTMLVPGDIVLLVGGNMVPADVVWLSGDRMKIDTAALTGEPIPRTYPSEEYGYNILCGTTVLSGEAYVQVSAIGTVTEIGKAQADLLKDKTVRIVSVFQTKVMIIVQVLVSCCFAMVIAVLMVKGTVHDGFTLSVKQTILDALSILIASIPVALPLVLQVNLALGAAFMAKNYHAIVTSIPALQDIASMSILCSDKTGTLTTANMTVIYDQIYSGRNFTAEEALIYARLCSNPDKKDDPIDQSIIRAFDSCNFSIKGYEQYDFIGFDPVVKRVISFVRNGDNVKMTIAKGLPAKILDTSAGGHDDHELQWKIDGYNDKFFMAGITQKDKKFSVKGYKTLAIAMVDGDAREMENPVWKFVGLLPMLDPPREDTAATIASLHHANVSVKMITGDHVNIGKETARLIGLGTNIHAGEEVRNAQSQEKKDFIWESDGFASVLPSDKREIVLVLKEYFGVVTGMTGDGVNDAAALSAAQVGIAVEGATDAAKNAADLILTLPGLSPIYGAILESRRIFARIKAYVVYRVAASIILSITLSVIIFASGCAVDSLLVIILALLNDISMIPVAYDKALATTKPQIPRAGKLIIQSLYFGLVHTALALIFIISLNHHGGRDVNLNEQCDSQTKGFIWFYLVLVTEISIFSVRSPSYFWKSVPSTILMVSVTSTCIIGALIAVFASDLKVSNMGYIIAYNVGIFILVDLVKVQFRNLIHEDPGDPIYTDDLIEVVVEEKTEMTMYAEKQQRYRVHNESALGKDEVDNESALGKDEVNHQVHIRQDSIFSGFFGDIPFSDGFLNQSYGRQRAFSSLPRTALPHDARRRRTVSTPASIGFY